MRNFYNFIDTFFGFDDEFWNEVEARLTKKFEERLPGECTKCDCPKCEQGVSIPEDELITSPEVETVPVCEDWYTTDTTCPVENDEDVHSLLAGSWHPYEGWLECDDSYDYSMRIPVRKESVEVELVENRLINISYEESKVLEQENGYQSSTFKGSTTVTLPENTDPNTLKVSFEYEILTLSVKKKVDVKEQSPTRKIEIL